MNFIRTVGPIGRLLRDVPSQVSVANRVRVHSPRLKIVTCGLLSFSTMVASLCALPHPRDDHSDGGALPSLCPHLQVPSTQKYFAERADIPTHLKKSTDASLMTGLYVLMGLGGVMFAKGEGITHRWQSSSPAAQRIVPTPFRRRRSPHGLKQAPGVEPRLPVCQLESRRFASLNEWKTPVSGVFATWSASYHGAWCS